MSAPLPWRQPVGSVGSSRIGGLVLAALVLAVSACALPVPGTRLEAQTDPSPGLLDRMLAADMVLLGELHDQPQHHRQRLQWLEAMAERRSIAIVMEQFDVGSQAAIDRARGELPTASLAQRARHLAEAAGFDFKGWEWSFYSPVVELAIARDLPLRAGNLSRGDAMQIAMGQPHPMAGPLPRGWDERSEAAMTRAIEQGHCGLLPRAMHAPLARAQRARDAQLAEVALQARSADRLPVLLAGNEHLRRDYGVPMHLLSREPALRIFSLAQFEDGAESSAAAFDASWRVPAMSRPDPCEPLRQRFGQTAPALPHPGPVAP